MLCKTNAIVLKTIKYSESGLVVKAFTENFGLKSFLIKGVRKKNPKHSSTLFQPLGLLEIVFPEKGNDRLIIPKEISPSFHFSSIPFNMHKSAMVLFLNELIYRCIHDNESNESLFHFVRSAVIELDSREDDILNMHLMLAMQMTQHLGFYPLGRFCPEKPYFKLREGVFSKYFSESDFCLDQSYAEHWDKLLDKDAESHTIKINSAERRQLLEYLISYYQLHLIGFGEIRSFEVLVQLFHA